MRDQAAQHGVVRKAHRRGDVLERRREAYGTPERRTALCRQPLGHHARRHAPRLRQCHLIAALRPARAAQELRELRRLATSRFPENHDDLVLLDL